MPRQLDPATTIFRIHQNKGFHMTFANLCTVSVQFGYTNYCDSNQGNYYNQPAGGVASPNAEVAARDAEGKWIHPEGFDFDGDDVIGYLTPDEVARFIQAVKDYLNAQTA